MTDELDQKWPYPNKVISLLMDLHKSGRLTTEEVQEINEVVFQYLDLRADKLEYR